MTRVVGHLDLDYFYAQVEEVEDPSIKTRPVLVCVFSGRTELSGVVATANYKAREYGAHSGMSIALARKKLETKDPVLIRMNRSKYESVSERVMHLVRERVDILEQTGIDEGFFDLTASSRGDFEQARITCGVIKDSVLRNERLKCTIGLGRSKVVAKLASDLAKPDGMSVIAPESTQAFLGPLPVSKLYGVGPKTSEFLESLGIKTADALSRADPQQLEDGVGRKLAAYLISASTGADSDAVRPNEGPTQFSRILTLKKDTRDPSEILTQLDDAISGLRKRLFEEGLSFRTVSAIAIFTDLLMKNKSKTFETPVVDLTTSIEDLKLLFADLCDLNPLELRRAGVRVSDFANRREQSTLGDFMAA